MHQHAQRRLHGNTCQPGRLSSIVHMPRQQDCMSSALLLAPTKGDGRPDDEAAVRGPRLPGGSGRVVG